MKENKYCLHFYEIYKISNTVQIIIKPCNENKSFLNLSHNAQNRFFRIFKNI